MVLREVAPDLQLQLGMPGRDEVRRLLRVRLGLVDEEVADHRNPLAAVAASGRLANRAHPMPARTAESPAKSRVGTRTPKKAPAIRRAPRQRVADDLELPQLG